MIVINGSLKQSLQAHFLEVGSIEHALLCDQRLQPALLDGLHQDVFLNRVLSDQSIDGDIAGLPYSVASVLGLLIHGGVPISIIEDDITGTCKVEPDAT